MDKKIIKLILCLILMGGIGYGGYYYGFMSAAKYCEKHCICNFR